MAISAFKSVSSLEKLICMQTSYYVGIDVLGLVVINSTIPCLYFNPLVHHHSLFRGEPSCIHEDTILLGSSTRNNNRCGIRGSPRRILCRHKIQEPAISSVTPLQPAHLVKAPMSNSPIVIRNRNPFNLSRHFQKCNLVGFSSSARHTTPGLSISLFPKRVDFHPHRRRAHATLRP